MLNHFTVPEAMRSPIRLNYEITPPSHISRPILVRAIAYRMQERVLGGLKPATRRLLQRVAEEVRAGGPVTAAPRVLKPGSGNRVDTIVVYKVERLRSLAASTAVQAVLAVA